MKRSTNLMMAAALLFALAALGCATSAATAPQDDAGTKHDAAEDANSQLDGPIFQYDGNGSQEDAAEDGTQAGDGATGSDGAITDGTSANDGTTVNDSGVSVRTINGTSIAHRLWDSGNADEPDDLSSASVAAFVANGSTYDTYAGTGDATGHFTIPNVPVGTYLLYVGGWFYRMSTDTPNLDYYVRGRAGIASTTTTTNLVFNVTGMSAYKQNQDDVIYYSSNTDAYDGIAYAGTQPAASATTLSKTYDLNGTNASKILATTDDHPILIDYVGTGSSTYLVSAATKSLSPTPYAQTDGASHNVSGAFTTISSTVSTSVNWYRSEFHGGTVIADIGPSAAFDNEYLIMTAQPGGLTHGAYCNGMDLAQLFGDANTGNLNFGSFSYGNPFDATWGQYLFTVVGATFSITAPGATTAATVTGWVRSWEARSSSMSVHMLVSPPRLLKVNGQAATANLTGATTTPVLSWTAPTTGTANTYQVFLYEVANSSGTTTRTGVAAFYTDQTSLQIPSGPMTAGKSYQFRVMAISEPNTTFGVSPWLSSFPHGDATAYTALVAP